MKNLIFTIIILSLITTSVFASPFVNESTEDYEKRYQQEFAPPKTTCGDGLCEGEEFETCPQDCKSPEEISRIITQENIAKEGEAKGSVLTKIAIPLFVAVVIISVIFLFVIMRKSTE